MEEVIWTRSFVFSFKEHMTGKMVVFSAFDVRNFGPVSSMKSPPKYMLNLPHVTSLRLIKMVISQSCSIVETCTELPQPKIPLAWFLWSSCLEICNWLLSLHNPCPHLIMQTHVYMETKGCDWNSEIKNPEPNQIHLVKRRFLLKMSNPLSNTHVLETCYGRVWLHNVGSHKF